MPRRLTELPQFFIGHFSQARSQRVVVEVCQLNKLHRYKSARLHWVVEMRKCFDGRMPQLDNATFAGAIVHALKRDAPLDQPENVVSEFTNRLLRAIATMRESASAV